MTTLKQDLRYGVRMLSSRDLSVSASPRLVSAENLLTAEAPRRRAYAENWNFENYPMFIYSCLSAVIGSTFVARRAGR